MYNAMNNNIEILGRGPSRSMGHGQYGWEGLGGCQCLAGLVLGVVFKIGEIKTASSDDSGGRVVGLLCVEP